MNKKEIVEILNNQTIHHLFKVKELVQIAKNLSFPKKKSKKKRIPATGPDTVLSMRRGRTFTDKKKQARKWACRQTKRQ